MENYDFYCRNYAGTFKVKNGTVYGSLDYIGKNSERKRIGNGFIVYPNGEIAYDFPYSVPKYVHNNLVALFCK